MLNVENLYVNYNGIEALRGISFHVETGEIVCLLGANGAGKSTTLRTISGLLTPKAGRIVFHGRDITGLAPEKIVKLGISQIPEGRQVFPGLTVMEHLELGAYVYYSDRSRKDDFKQALEQVFELFPALVDRQKQLAGTLSGGEQQMLAIARGLMSNPRLLLLDEPSLGLSPILVKTIFKIIGRVNGEEGTTILLVEQNARMALSLAQYGYILEVGRIVLEDSSEELIQNEDVREFYLGQKERSVRGSKRWKRKKKWR